MSIKATAIAANSRGIQTRDYGTDAKTSEAEMDAEMNRLLARVEAAKKAGTMTAAEAASRTQAIYERYLRF